MSRAQKVRDLLLANPSSWFSVREVLQALGMPATEAKFVSSIFVGLEKSSSVTAASGRCSVTQKSVKVFCWGNPASAPKSATAAAGSPKKSRQRKSKATPPPSAPPQQPPPPRLTRDQLRRAAARRAAAAAGAEQRRLQAEQAAKNDRIARAKIAFKALTGCEPSPNKLDEMKRAYRKAAMVMHPDRGGDAAKFAELSSAWNEIEAIFC